MQEHRPSLRCAATGLVPGRPVSYVLPRPISVQALESIADRFFEKVPTSFTSALHLIAIAKSGYPIATAVTLRSERHNPVLSVYLSGIDPFAPLNTFDDLPQLDSVLTVLVDNSVKTGQTALQALKVATESGLQIDQLVKIINYDDEAERESVKLIADSFPKVEIVSLFDVSEIEGLKSELA